VLMLNSQLYNTVVSDIYITGCDRDCQWRLSKRLRTPSPPFATEYPELGSQSNSIELF
jgi:hypothetical protein